MKKQILVAAVLSIILIPFLTNAQTNSSLIEQLKAQVARLQIILQTLIHNSQSTPISTPTVPTPPTPPTSTTVTQPFSVEPLTPIERVEVRMIKEAIYGSNNQDYLTLFQALDSRRGDFGRIVSLCAEFDPIFCFKRASKDNPTFRAELCRVMSFELGKKYKNKLLNERMKENLKDHQIECELGIPQFIIW